MSLSATANAVQFAVTAMGGGVRRVGQPAEGRSPSDGLSSATTVASGHRSERVLSLLMALEALRAAPDVLGPDGSSH